jgi:hypothetical protein
MFKKLLKNNFIVHRSLPFIVHRSEFIVQKGVSIYLALIIMIILLAIGLGITTIIVFQMKMIRGMGDSVIALYAADTGIERALYGDGTPAPHYGPTPINGSSYEVNVFCCQQGTGTCLWGVGECSALGLTEDSTCNAFYLCYKSVGTYKGIRRAIETTR